MDCSLAVRQAGDMHSTHGETAALPRTAPREASSATLRIVVSVPRPAQGGGVAAFWQTVLDSLPCQVAVVEIGRKTSGEKWPAKATRGFADLVRLLRETKRSRSELVVLNPSLDPKSLVRDGLSLLALTLRRRRVFVFVRGWDSAVALRISRRWRRLFVLVYGRAVCVAVLASSFQAELRSWGLRVPMAVVTTAALSPPETRGEARSRGAKSACLQLLFMARLIPDKGLDALLRACAILEAEGLAIALVVAGDGPERASAERLTKELGLTSVTFVGNAAGAQKRELLADSDVFVLPSKREGMPNAVLEAFSYSLAVVATPIGGLADFLKDDVDCLLLGSVTPLEIAEKLRRLVNDPGLCRRLGETACAEASRFFLPDVVGARMGRLFALAARKASAQDYFWFDEPVSVRAGDAVDLSEV